MSNTKRAWIINPGNHFIVQKTGKIYEYTLVPSERAGFTTTKAAKAELYHARRALHDEHLVVTTFF